MKKNLFVKLSILLALLLFLAGCGNSESSPDDQTLKIGSMEGLQSEVLDVAVEKLEEQGYTVEIVTFSDYQAPNTALEENSLDANIFQHTPFLDSYNRDKGTDFVSAGAAFLNPMAIYSENYLSIDEVQDGDLFALPNDPTNMGRALLVLEATGLIEIEEGVDNPTTDDIIENSKNLEFIELEPAQVTASLEDVDFAAINSNYAVDFGLNPKEDSIFTESIDSPYTVQIVTTQELNDSQKISDLVAAYQNDAVVDAMDELSNGTLLPGWK
ncbi:MAG: MetQ/NlpA family ABC transporter substrate-binding protein [Atopococcus tabaci]|uniref:Lipoprotein n=1 Tax=Atopococcus tabaci TaxID=269774 RepID=A0AA43ZSA1_9LACT|nr:MetQ/NlpA family ABC transporter substrate-binding protein [Atopococcus tabaci]